MLSRREKLLNRPWQLRRYNNHRSKVICALPVIDFGPPKEHKHVTTKLKKQQRENERREKIEEDNFKLLQRMGSIMQKSRVENFWKTPPPNFLHKVGIFYRTRSPTPTKYFENNDQKNVGSKPIRCSACYSNAARSAAGPDIPEERTPWEPPRPRVSRKSSIPILSHTHPLSAPTPTTHANIDKKQPRRSRSVTIEKITLPADSKKKMILKKNDLEFIVNFPSRAEVRIVSGNETKINDR